MMITVGELQEANSLQYKITDKEYRDLDCLYMKSVLDCSGVATIVTESHFKGHHRIILYKVYNSSEMSVHCLITKPNINGTVISVG